MTVIMLSLAGGCSILQICGVKMKGIVCICVHQITVITDRRVSNVLRLSCSFRYGEWTRAQQVTVG